MNSEPQLHYHYQRNGDTAKLVLVMYITSVPYHKNYRADAVYHREIIHDYDDPNTGTTTLTMMMGNPVSWPDKKVVPLPQTTLLPIVEKPGLLEALETAEDYVDWVRLGYAQISQGLVIDTVAVDYLRDKLSCYKWIIIDRDEDKSVCINVKNVKDPIFYLPIDSVEEIMEKWVEATDLDDDKETWDDLIEKISNTEELSHAELPQV